MLFQITTAKVIFPRLEIWMANGLCVCQLVDDRQSNFMQMYKLAKQVELVPREPVALSGRFVTAYENSSTNLTRLYDENKSNRVEN